MVDMISSQSLITSVIMWRLNSERDCLLEGRCIGTPRG